MAAFIASFLFVVLAEMGDKTQLLVMAFAARYHPAKVLLAVFLATAVNHALAVAVGRFLTVVIPIDIISFVAALSFVGFGLWTIRGDALHGEEKRESRFGPVMTVGIAFFLAEMGDKTQLATVSLAVKYQSMIWVLLGTTLGMVVADAFSIVAGVVLRKHIPERTIKWLSACIFILFGLASLHTVLSARMGAGPVSVIIAVVAALTACGAYRLAQSGKRQLQ